MDSKPMEVVGEYARMKGKGHPPKFNLAAVRCVEELKGRLESFSKKNKTHPIDDLGCAEYFNIPARELNYILHGFTQDYLATYLKEDGNTAFSSLISSHFSQTMQDGKRTETNYEDVLREMVNPRAKRGKVNAYKVSKSSGTTTVGLIIPGGGGKQSCYKSNNAQRRSSLAKPVGRHLTVAKKKAMQKKVQKTAFKAAVMKKSPMKSKTKKMPPMKAAPPMKSAPPMKKPTPSRKEAGGGASNAKKSATTPREQDSESAGNSRITTPRDGKTSSRDPTRQNPITKEDRIVEHVFEAFKVHNQASASAAATTSSAVNGGNDGGNGSKPISDDDWDNVLHKIRRICTPEDRIVYFVTLLLQENVRELHYAALYYYIPRFQHCLSNGVGLLLHQSLLFGCVGSDGSPGKDLKTWNRLTGLNDPFLEGSGDESSSYIRTLNPESSVNKGSRNVYPLVDFSGIRTQDYFVELQSISPNSRSTGLQRNAINGVSVVSYNNGKTGKTHVRALEFESIAGLSLCAESIIAPFLYNEWATQRFERLGISPIPQVSFWDMGNGKAFMKKIKMDANNTISFIHPTLVRTNQMEEPKQTSMKKEPGMKKEGKGGKNGRVNSNDKNKNYSSAPLKEFEKGIQRMVASKKSNVFRLGDIMHNNEVEEDLIELENERRTLIEEQEKLEKQEEERKRREEKEAIRLRKQEKLENDPKRRKMEKQKEESAKLNDDIESYLESLVGNSTTTNSGVSTKKSTGNNSQMRSEVRSGESQSPLIKKLPIPAMIAGSSPRVHTNNAGPFALRPLEISPRSPRIDSTTPTNQVQKSTIPSQSSPNRKGTNTPPSRSKSPLVTPRDESRVKVFRPVENENDIEMSPKSLVMMNSENDSKRNFSNRNNRSPSSGTKHFFPPNNSGTGTTNSPTSTNNKMLSPRQVVLSPGLSAAERVAAVVMATSGRKVENQGPLPSVIISPSRMNSSRNNSASVSHQVSPSASRSGSPNRTPRLPQDWQFAIVKERNDAEAPGRNEKQLTVEEERKIKEEGERRRAVEAQRIPTAEDVVAKLRLLETQSTPQILVKTTSGNEHIIGSTNNAPSNIMNISKSAFANNTSLVRVMSPRMIISDPKILAKVHNDLYQMNRPNGLVLLTVMDANPNLMLRANNYEKHIRSLIQLIEFLKRDLLIGRKDLVVANNSPKGGYNTHRILDDINPISRMISSEDLKKTKALLYAHTCLELDFNNHNQGRSKKSGDLHLFEYHQQYELELSMLEGSAHTHPAPPKPILYNLLKTANIPTSILGELRTEETKKRFEMYIRCLANSSSLDRYISCLNISNNLKVASTCLLIAAKMLRWIGVRMIEESKNGSPKLSPKRMPGSPSSKPIDYRKDDNDDLKIHFARFQYLAQLVFSDRKTDEKMTAVVLGRSFSLVKPITMAILQSSHSSSLAQSATYSVLFPSSGPSSWTPSFQHKELGSDLDALEKKCLDTGNWSMYSPRVMTCNKYTTVKDEIFHMELDFESRILLHVSTDAMRQKLIKMLQRRSSN